MLHFRDGVRGDKDLTADGRIDDHGVPGIRIDPIPTLTEWGMIFFIIFLAGFGMVMIKRRKLCPYKGFDFSS